MKMAMLVLVLAASAHAAALDKASYDAAFAQARAANRPVAIVAAAPSWDDASKSLVAALAQPAVEAWLSHETIAVRMDPSVDGPDADTRPFAAVQLEALGIHELPSVTLMEPGGATLGTFVFEAQSSTDLRTALAGLVAARGWNERLARLDHEDAQARLADAVDLMRHAAPLLGARLVSVADIVFTLDTTDASGLRADAALMVASGTDTRADAAIDYLEKIAPADPQRRFGFVMFSKSGHTLERLMTRQSLVKAGKEKAASLRPIASELLAQVNRARPYAPNDDVRGQLMVRAALAFKIAGEQAKAEAALATARALAARYAATQTRNDDPQLAAVR